MTEEEYGWTDDEYDSQLLDRQPPATGLRGALTWIVAAVRGLLDVRFRVVATTTLLPAVYVLGLVVSITLPILLAVAVFQFSVVLGVLFLLLVALPLGLAIAATVRLVLEFLINVTKLASRVTYMTALADDLHNTLADVAVPVSQLSEDVRAVQFWRFRQRRQNSPRRRVR